MRALVKILRVLLATCTWQNLSCHYIHGCRCPEDDSMIAHKRKQSACWSCMPMAGGDMYCVATMTTATCTPRCRMPITRLHGAACCAGSCPNQRPSASSHGGGLSCQAPQNQRQFDGRKYNARLCSLW